MKRWLKKTIIIIPVLLLFIFVSECIKPIPPTPFLRPPPIVALVLSGGASRGFAHVGVIKVLEEAGIPIDIIVGTSAGSLTGAMYAYYMDAEILEREARDLRRRDIFDFNILGLFVGFVSGKRIIRFVEEKIGVKNIEDLGITFVAVATNLNTGKRVVFKSGPISTAIRASTSIPGIFKPLHLDDMVLVDGGVVDGIPIDVAREMGADVIIAVDVTAGAIDFDVNNVIEIILQTFNIMEAEINRYRIGEADVVIRPLVSGVGMLDFSEKDYLIKEGERAAREALPEIREAIRSAWWSE